MPTMTTYHCPLSAHLLHCHPTSMVGASRGLRHEGATVSDAQVLEDTATRRQAAIEWFELASKHARAAVLLAEAEGLETDALYMTQQSMEAGAKGIARGAGLTHREVYGHNNLRLFIRVVHEAVKVTETATHIDNLLAKHIVKGESYNTVGQLHEILKLTTSQRDTGNQEKEAKEFFESMLTVPPQAVAIMLKLLKDLDSTVEAFVNYWAPKVTSTPFVLKAPPSNKGLTTAIFLQLLTQIAPYLRGLSKAELFLARKLIRQLVANAIAAKGEEQFRSELAATGWHYSISRNEVAKTLDLPVAFLGMLTVGGLVWPHESYTRYVASPQKTPLTFEQAAKKRQLGVGYYSETVGVIKYIRELSVRAEKIITLLEDSYKAGYLFPDWAGTT